MSIGVNTYMQTAVPIAPPSFGMFICSHCSKIVRGGEIIQGVFYCPMCASIIRANNARSKWPTDSLRDVPECCRKCKNHLLNGGSGTCNCILGSKIWY